MYRHKHFKYSFKVWLVYLLDLCSLLWHLKFDVFVRFMLVTVTFEDLICLSCCPFSFDHCIICPSSIYRFWHLQSFLIACIISYKQRMYAVITKNINKILNYSRLRKCAHVLCYRQSAINLKIFFTWNTFLMSYERKTLYKPCLVN
jgi:hypothetical protein